MRVPMLVKGVMRMTDVGESVVLRAPNGARHHIQVDNDGVLSSSTGIIYNETLVIGVGGVSTGTPVTLPASGNYLGGELEIRLDTVLLYLGSDYQYVGAGVKTQVEFTFDLVNGDELTFKKIV